MQFFISFALAVLAVADKLQPIRDEFFKAIAASNPPIEPKIAVGHLKNAKWNALEEDYEAKVPISVARDLLKKEKTIAQELGVEAFNYRDYFHAYPVPDWVNTGVDTRVRRELSEAVKHYDSDVDYVSAKYMKSYYKGISKKAQADGFCEPAAIKQYESNAELLPVVNVWRAAAEIKAKTQTSGLQKRGLGKCLLVCFCCPCFFAGAVGEAHYNLAEVPSRLHAAIGLLQGLQGPKLEDQELSYFLRNTWF